MAVVLTEEIISGRSVSGRARESFEYTRQFLVQTDDPKTSLVDIANGPGISFGDAHPDDASVYALEFNAQAAGENPLLYTLSVKYGLPAATETAADPGSGGGGGGGGVQAPSFATPPGDVWSGGADLKTTGAMFLPKAIGGAPQPVANTAGVLFRDVTTEQARYTLTLARSYANTSFLGLLANYTNKCNSATWAGCARYTWLCKGGRWTRETQSAAGVVLMYYRVNWEFEFNPDTWDLRLPSMGYQELKSGKLVDIMNDDSPPKPVAEPRALTQTGAAATPGAAPYQVQFFPHGEIDFTAAFGGVY